MSARGCPLHRDCALMGNERGADGDHPMGAGACDFGAAADDTPGGKNGGVGERWYRSQTTSRQMVWVLRWIFSRKFRGGDRRWVWLIGRVARLQAEGW